MNRDRMAICRCWTLVARLMLGLVLTGCNGNGSSQDARGDQGVPDTQPADRVGSETKAEIDADREPSDGLPLEQTQQDSKSETGGETVDVTPVEYPCEATQPDILCVGAAARTITPPGFETVNPAYLDEENTEEDPNRCFMTDVLPRCGELRDNYRDDCGHDATCAGDLDYLAPDEDGSEDDGVADWYDDCGLDRLCADDTGYPGPDEDGTEGNGKFDGFWLAGFGSNRPVAGVLNDLWARALVLHHKDDTIGYFAADLVGFFYSDFQLVRQRFAEKYPADHIDYILMQSTHSHEAPDSMGQYGESDPQSGLPMATGVVGWWQDWMIEQMADALHDAYQSQRRARFFVGQGNTGVQGMLEDWRSPTIIDDKMMTMQFTAEDSGQVIATTVHWANHPESLWARNNFISSDYAHHVRQFVEQGLPARGDLPAVPGFGGIAIYMQGAVGGIMSTPDHTAYRDGTPTTHRGLQNTEALGERIAMAAYDILAAAEPITDLDGLRWVARQHVLRMENVAFQLAFFTKLFPRRTLFTRDGLPRPPHSSVTQVPPYIQTEQAIVRIGPSVTWFTYPNEAFPEFAIGGFDGSRVCGRSGTTDCGYELLTADADANPPDLASAPAGPYTEEIVPGRYKFLLGLALDELGYCVPPYDFKLSADAPYLEAAPGEHYEETNSIGPQAAKTDLVIRELAVTAAALYDARD